MQDRVARLCGIVLMVLSLAGDAWAETRSWLSPDGRSLTLYPGERLVLRLGPGAVINVISAQRVDPAAALPPKPGSRTADAPLTMADPDTVTLLLGGDAAQTVLRFESGLSLAFDYRATLRRGDADQPTSVCTVLPLLAGFEIWPYAVASVTLGGFATRSTNEVTCSTPPKMETTAPWPSTPKPASS